MTNQEFMAYLPEKAFGIFSTVREDGMPEARGWEFQFAENGRFYFATANNKPVWEELQANPKAAFTYMEPSGKFTVRITGEVKVVTDMAEKQALFDRIDNLVKGMYRTYDNPVFEIVYLEHCTCKLAKGFATPETVA